MSKSMLTLAPAVTAVALAPLAAEPARAANLPNIDDAYGEQDHNLENCTVEVPPSEVTMASGHVAVDPAAGRTTLDYALFRSCPRRRQDLCRRG